MFHSSGLAASRSWMPAAVISTVCSRPMVSTAMCRFRPLTFLPASNPRLSLATVSAALTDRESMTAADGSGLRPAAIRRWLVPVAYQDFPAELLPPGLAGG